MKKHSAFSLIELSIVILIIGILIAGVTQSSRLVKQMRIMSARTLTQSSPVAGVKDLTLWYETSLESSFSATESENGLNLSNWFDNNPQSTYKYNATQGTTVNKPFYTENVFNGGIPAVSFNGDDFFLFDGSFLANTSYTIFAIEQRRAAPGNPFIGGTNLGDNLMLHTGYIDDVTIRFAHFGNGTNLDYTIPGYSAPIPRMHSFRFSKTEGKSYWINGGGNTPDSADPAQTTALISFIGSAIGRYNTIYYTGDIGEIIIFSRDLKNEERQAIETYLSKKYGIAIS